MNLLKPKFRELLAAGALFHAAACGAQPIEKPAADTLAEPTPRSVGVVPADPVEPVRTRPMETIEADVPDKIRVGEIVSVLNDAVLRENEEAWQVVVVMGDVQIDGRVRRDLVVVGGKARVNGTVEGDVVVPFGSLELGPNAHLKGDIFVIGGALKSDPAAVMDRKPREISWIKMEEKLPLLAGVRKWVVQGLILARPLPHQFGWWTWAALACALVYILTGAVFARPISATVAALESQPIGSFFTGALTFILFGPLVLLLLATGVGVLIVPFVLCGAFVAFVFGKVGVYRYAGQQVVNQFRASATHSPLVALVVGIALFYLLYMVPLLGFLVWGLVAPLGFGAATLACFRAFRSEGNGTKGVTTAAAVLPSIPAQGAPTSPMDVALLPRAGFWIRLAATFLDLVLVGAISALTGVPPFFLIAWVAYHVAMWAWKGTTIGGIVLGIKIFRRDGRPVDFAVALVRSLASFFSALVLFIGFFWAGWNREKLSWHDKIAGTIIVKVPGGLV